MFPMSGPSLIMNNDETLSVMRQSQTVGAGVTYVDGKPMQDASLYMQFQVICNVQPLSGKDLLLLPEGQRFADQFWLYSNQREQAIETNDLVMRQGNVYQVQASENWGSYTRALCTLDDSQYLPDQPSIFSPP